MFTSRSSLLTDGEITHVYYNAETEPERVDSLLIERNADQTKQPLKEVVPISKIKDQALVFAVELTETEDLDKSEKKDGDVRPPLFMDSNEKDIETKANLFKYDHVCMGGTFDHMH